MSGNGNGTHDTIIPELLPHKQTAFVTSSYLEGGITEKIAARHTFHETAVDRYSQYYLLSFLIYQGINSVRSPHTAEHLPLNTELFSTLEAFAKPTTLEAYIASQQASKKHQQFLRQLIDYKFLFPKDVAQDRQFYLTDVEIDPNTVCNQACTYCPVSIDPRKRDNIAETLFDEILSQVAAINHAAPERTTIHLAAYNEITLDKRYPSFVEKMKRYGFNHCVYSNGSFLKPELVDKLVDLGVKEFVLNVPALDEEQYFKLRGTRDIAKIVENLEYLATKKTDSTIVVHGVAGHNHYRNFRQMKKRFEGMPIKVKMGQTMDRIGYVDEEFKSTTHRDILRGCMNGGSRVINWVHISSKGVCYICPMDYYYKHVMGDMTTETLEQIMTGDRMATLRRYVYGVEEAPEDFICRKCVSCIPGSWKDASASDVTPLNLQKSRLKAKVKLQLAEAKVMTPLYLHSLLHK
jgi:MoaA/NifB/PqqE/SkfB family radical SAM enzyme